MIYWTLSHTSSGEDFFTIHANQPTCLPSGTIPKQRTIEMSPNTVSEFTHVIHNKKHDEFVNFLKIDDDTVALDSLNEDLRLVKVIYIW